MLGYRLAPAAASHAARAHSEGVRDSVRGRVARGLSAGGHSRGAHTRTSNRGYSHPLGCAQDLFMMQMMKHNLLN